MKKIEIVGQVCEYDPVRDVERVVQDGYLDLAQAHALGSVPAMLDSSDSDFDGTTDPAAIAGKPDDVFSAMQAGKVIESRGKKSENQE